MDVKPWKENCVYPGTHWLLYSVRGDYVARVDLQPFYNGIYQWQAFMFDMFEGRRQCGFAKTLEEAQQIAQAIVEGKPVQLMLELMEA
jgi:hypothetical protein